MRKQWFTGMVICVLSCPVLLWAQDIKDGYGKKTMPDGSVYEGQFTNGVFEGEGTLNMPNGQQYAGEFKNGLYDGKGVLLYIDGSKYEGEFKEGQLNGQGVITYTDGTPPYKGNFKDGDIDIPAPVDSSAAAYEQKSP